MKTAGSARLAAVLPSPFSASDDGDGLRLPRRSRERRGVARWQVPGCGRLRIVRDYRLRGPDGARIGDASWRRPRARRQRAARGRFRVIKPASSLRQRRTAANAAAYRSAGVRRPSAQDEAKRQIVATVNRRRRARAQNRSRAPTPTSNISVDSTPTARSSPARTASNTPRGRSTSIRRLRRRTCVAADCYNTLGCCR